MHDPYMADRDGVFHTRPLHGVRRLLPPPVLQLWVLNGIFSLYALITASPGPTIATQEDTFYIQSHFLVYP
jgi:hypothetical protein